MKHTHRLIALAVIGLTFGAWFTIDTGGLYAYQILIVCAGLLVALLCCLAGVSIKTEKPHRRFTSHGVVL